MPRDIHGTRQDPAKHHPVLDINHWLGELPIGEKRQSMVCVDSVTDLVYREHACALAASRGDLGTSVPVDLFTWSYFDDPDKRWLTRLGGYPWRSPDKPWPKDEEGVPLHFLGQICFADSKDLIPFKLPGDVACIFGRWQDSYTFVDEGGVLEWWPTDIEVPDFHSEGWTSRLPFKYQGVIHRSTQYTDDKQYGPRFEAAGWENGGGYLAECQATSIGTYSSLPQGWPFEEGDGNTLVATLSSFYFGDRWPLCDVPRGLTVIRGDGTETNAIHPSGLSMGIGDAGCVWIYRNKQGEFKMDSAGG